MCEGCNVSKAVQEKTPKVSPFLQLGSLFLTFPPQFHPFPVFWTGCGSHYNTNQCEITQRWRRLARWSYELPQPGPWSRKQKAKGNHNHILSPQKRLLLGITYRKIAKGGGYLPIDGNGRKMLSAWRLVMKGPGRLAVPAPDNKVWREQGEVIPPHPTQGGRDTDPSKGLPLFLGNAFKIHR